MTINILNVSLITSFLVLSTSTNAALLERLGGLAYYDTEADLTWLADANAAGMEMNWADANAWAMDLNVAGVTGWRLPNTIDVDNDGGTYTSIYQGVDYGWNITTHSELSNMFYNVLGNKGFYDTSGALTGCDVPPDWCLINTGPFSNLMDSHYWSSTENITLTNRAWFFNMLSGDQGDSAFKSYTFNAWAVHSGDVSAVPVPAAIWLFGSGVVCLAGLSRRKKYK